MAKKPTKVTKLPGIKAAARKLKAAEDETSRQPKRTPMDRPRQPKVQRPPGKVMEPEGAKNAPPGVVTLTSLYTKRQQWIRFRQWIVGLSPLICHAWSEKAKIEMLSKMVKAVKHAKEERDPEQEFADSLYQLEGGGFGFPITALKKAILSQAHKDKGIAKVSVMAGLWLDFEVIQARPAYAHASCDMPICRIYGDDPKMREDMVRIKGRGGSTANFAYRSQFTTWAMLLTGKVDSELVPGEVLAWLVNGGGSATGIGDWRNEKSGIFGAFRLASITEADQWEKFVAGKGPLPRTPDLTDPDELQAAE